MLILTLLLSRTSPVSRNFDFQALIDLSKLPIIIPANSVAFVLTIWRASEASETLIGLNNGNRRYIYIYIVRETSL